MFLITLGVSLSECGASADLYRYMNLTVRYKLIYMYTRRDTTNSHIPYRHIMVFGVLRFVANALLRQLPCDHVPKHANNMLLF